MKDLTKDDDEYARKLFEEESGAGNPYMNAVLGENPFISREVGSLDLPSTFPIHNDFLHEPTANMRNTETRVDDNDSADEDQIAAAIRFCGAFILSLIHESYKHTTISKRSFVTVRVQGLASKSSTSTIIDYKVLCGLYPLFELMSLTNILLSRSFVTVRVQVLASKSSTSTIID